MESSIDAREVSPQMIGRLAVEHVSTVSVGSSAIDAVRTARGDEKLSAAHVAVVENERLVGVVPPERLLQADSAELIESLIEPRVPMVGPTADAEGTCWAAAQAGVATVAVVDEDGRLRGLVPPRTVIAVLAHEHEVDLARLGGYLRASTLARVASTEPIRARFWHRLPWLLVGLVAALASALIVSGFEQSLEEEVALAFFLPGIVYMADAVGTQTETLILRGLSVGVGIGRVVLKELATGLAMGLVLAVGFFSAALVFGVGASIAVVVGVSLFVACATASAVAMVLPAILSRLGTDPAFGSGPLATVAQDLISIAVYLGIAAAILGG